LGHIKLFLSFQTTPIIRNIGELKVIAYQRCKQKVTIQRKSTSEKKVNFDPQNTAQKTKD